MKNIMILLLVSLFLLSSTCKDDSGTTEPAPEGSDAEVTEVTEADITAVYKEGATQYNCSGVSQATIDTEGLEDTAVRERIKTQLEIGNTCEAVVPDTATSDSDASA